MPSHLTRRQALRQTVFFSAAALLGRWPASSSALPLSNDARHFLLLGDFGRDPEKDKSNRQSTVAAAMQRYVAAQAIKPEGLFLLGDNFYGPMPGGVASRRWQTGFEDMYPKTVFPGPCWAMLGNHDYDEDNGLKLASEMQYADAHPGTRWQMPAKWYRVDWPAVNPLFTCLVLDSNYRNKRIYLTNEERTAQLNWLKAELAKPRTAPWLMCMGHHPMYSNGTHGDTKALIQDWGSLFQNSGVAFYFCGHDHDLQHLEFEGMKTSFVVSGGGGATITTIKKPGRGVFSASTLGFTHLEVTPEKCTVRHIGPNGELFHAFNRTAAGKVTVLGGTVPPPPAMPAATPSPATKGAAPAADAD